jgi:phosphatidylserine/phosphatidylglycerophosphate/cardiolipin synthase-like enzyme
MVTAEQDGERAVVLVCLESAMAAPAGGWALYLSPHVPVHREDSTVEPVVDGRAWMARMGELLTCLAPGDAAYVSGFLLDPDMDLDGRAPSDPGHLPFGELLASLAETGVDVRVLLAGAVFVSDIAWPRTLPFRENVRTARRLRRWAPAGARGRRPPLAGRVLLDWSGARLGSNHQKFTIVRRAGVLTAGVAGIDYAANRLDATPHARQVGAGTRWGWHDAGVVVAGAVAADVWQVFRRRWAAAVRLPPRRYYWPRLRFPLLNHRAVDAPVAPAPAQARCAAPRTAAQVLQSVAPWYVDSLLPWRRRRHPDLPVDGVYDAYETLVRAISAARRYIYIEDQYFDELPGGDSRFEIFSHVREAAARGVKVIFLGSGTRDPAELGLPVNRVVNRHLTRTVVDRLPPDRRRNVGLWRVEHLTVHSKIVLIDDVFTCIGSANFFSRSMTGVDVELAVATVTTDGATRDLRVALWAEHLRTPLTDPRLWAALADLDLALGAFRPEWLPPTAPAGTWRVPNMPPGFAPRERVLTLVGPP